eukprot:scaffold7459_cov21-Phaeocystis_antarctica.AAC.1
MAPGASRGRPRAPAMKTSAAAFFSSFFPFLFLLLSCPSAAIREGTEAGGAGAADAAGGRGGAAGARKRRRSSNR